MDITLKNSKRIQKQPKMKFSEWVLKTIKQHKKRADIDVIVGLSITTIILLVNLV